MERQNNDKLSKEEMARRISMSVNARSSEEELSRVQRRISQEREYTPRESMPDNPYIKDEKKSTEKKNPAQTQKTAEKKHRNTSNSASKKKKKKSAKKTAKAMRRKKLLMRRLAASAVAIVLIAGAAAIGASAWFKKGMENYDGLFLDNTYINGVNVSRQTVDEAATLVKQYSDMPDVITLTRPDGVDVTVPLSDLDSKDNIKSNVNKIFKEQNHRDWFKARSQDSDYSFTLKFDFDREKLYKEVDNKIVQGGNPAKSKNAYIERTSSGFQIVPETIGTTVDKKKVQALYDYIDGFLERGVYAIDLKNCNCYKLPAVVSEDLTEQLGVLNALYDVEFTFDFGYTKETLEGKTCINWITFENDNPLEGFTVDEDQTYSYVQQLADKYDTYGKDRTFKSTTRGKMTIEQGAGEYGWQIDLQKTANMLTDLIRDGISAEVEPYYLKTAGDFQYVGEPEWRTADSDYSDTYIEIDLKEQHLWYYKDGRKEYECDIVSGKPTAARNTEAGVYKLWYKELNKTLVGSNWAGESWSTFVNYWNSVSTFGVGLHDATWHPYFGGDRYVTDGSHGCINMPLEAAKYVYDNVPLNIPVFMYW